MSPRHPALRTVVQQPHWKLPLCFSAPCRGAAMSWATLSPSPPRSLPSPHPPQPCLTVCSAGPIPRGPNPGLMLLCRKKGGTETLGSFLDWEIRKAGLGAELHLAIGRTARHGVRQEPGPSMAVTKTCTLGEAASQLLFPAPLLPPPKSSVGRRRRCPARRCLLESSKPRGKPSSTAPGVLQAIQARVLLFKHPYDHRPVQTPSLPDRQTLRISPLICLAVRGTAQLCLSAERGQGWEFRFCHLSAWGLCQRS